MKGRCERTELQPQPPSYKLASSSQQPSVPSQPRGFSSHQELDRILCTMSSERPYCLLLHASATMPSLLSPIERGQGHSRVPSRAACPARGGLSVSLGCTEPGLFSSRQQRGAVPGTAAEPPALPSTKSRWDTQDLCFALLSFSSLNRDARQLHLSQINSGKSQGS